MITPQVLTQFSPRETAMGTNRFLFIASDYKPWPGGIASYIDSLARGLMSLGDQAKVLAVVQPEEIERIKFLEAYEPWVIPFPLVHDAKPRNWLGRKCVSLLEILRYLSPTCRHLLDRAPFFKESTGSIERLERVLLKEDPTVVIFGHLDIRLSALTLPLLEKQLPYGILAHDFEICPLPNNKKKKNDFVKRGQMVKRASWIAANSNHTKALLEMWSISPDRVRVIHPPVSEEAIKESALLGLAPRKDQSFTLVTVCRVVKGKGIDIVLRALKILDARGIPFRYVVGGDGPERGSLEALVDELGLAGRVLFKGSITDDEKWGLLRNSDVFVMPSRVDPKVQHEGFGIAFIEAAAFGVPAVGSKAGGIPEAVVDGETGVLVSPESSVDLADALTSLYLNPETRKRMGMAARERARMEFSPTAIATTFRAEIIR